MTALASIPQIRPWTWLPDLGQRQLPRYTSYPPATRFTPVIDATSAAEAQRNLAPGSTLSLYIHIPFCEQLCWYCGCHTSVPTIANPLGGYLDTLHQEIRQAAARLPAGIVVTHLHFGGGSPDILSADQIRALGALLHATFEFAPNAEIAAEIDPRGLTPARAQAFAGLGLTRASLGLQTLAPEVQKRINRIQPAETVAAAVRMLREVGVDHLNLDLMYGLPGQTAEDVAETARFAASLNADRVALFGYAHVPWMKKHQNGIRTEELPVGEPRFRQAEAGAAVLLRAGYRPIGFDHYASPSDALSIAEASGALRRNFQGYTADTADALLGLGASAISTFPHVTWQNAPTVSAWREAIEAEQPAAIRGVRPSAEDLRIGRLIEQLLCQLEADIPADLKAAARADLLLLEGAGLIQWCWSRLMITEKGRPYARQVAAAFDPDMRGDPGRYSLAV